MSKTQRSRVCTFMFGTAARGQTCPMLGIREGHHERNNLWVTLLDAMDIRCGHSATAPARFRTCEFNSREQNRCCEC